MICIHHCDRLLPVIQAFQMVLPPVILCSPHLQMCRLLRPRLLRRSRRYRRFLRFILQWLEQRLLQRLSQRLHPRQPLASRPLHPHMSQTRQLQVLFLALLVLYQQALDSVTCSLDLTSLYQFFLARLRRPLVCRRMVLLQGLQTWRLMHLLVFQCMVLLPEVQAWRPMRCRLARLLQRCRLMDLLQATQAWRPMRSHLLARLLRCMLQLLTNLTLGTRLSFSTTLRQSSVSSTA